jgi:hypothetical protein
VIYFRETDALSASVSQQRRSAISTYQPLTFPKNIFLEIALIHLKSLYDDVKY